MTVPVTVYAYGSVDSDIYNDAVTAIEDVTDVDHVNGTLTYDSNNVVGFAVALTDGGTYLTKVAEVVDALRNQGYLLSWIDYHGQGM